MYVTMEYNICKQYYTKNKVPIEDFTAIGTFNNFTVFV